MHFCILLGIYFAFLITGANIHFAVLKGRSIHEYIQDADSKTRPSFTLSQQVVECKEASQGSLHQAV